MESAFVEIELSMLFPDPSQPRKVFDEEAINALREDIKANGLKEPLDINPLLDGRTTKYLIIDGECRFHAIEGIDDFGMVPCNLHAYKSQREIDRHRASKHFHRKDWNPADRAEWLKYYISTHKIRQQELAREFSVKQSTVSEWLAPTRDARLLKALRNGEIGFKQAVLLSRVDDAETRENALRDAIGKSKTDTEEIIARAIITPETPKEEGVSETEITDREALINSIDENLRERLIDATKDMTLHDTERVVKQVAMGVRIDEAVRAVKLSKVEAPQEEKGVEEIKVHEGTEATEEETIDESGGRPPSVPETDSIREFGDSIINKEKGAEGEEEVEEPERKTCPTCNGNAYLKQSSSQVLCSDCGGKGFILKEKLEREAEPQESAKPEIPMSEDEPPPETKPTDPKPIKFVNSMLKLGEATKSHMNEKELEALADSNYRKLLKDYEEASFSIDGFRDFLQSRENNGSVQYNRAKRLHSALGRFDAHTISSLKEATNLRTIKINTKKKLTKDINTLDTTIKNKAKKGA